MQLDTTERHIMGKKGSRHTLMIRKVHPQDFGNYSVIHWNIFWVFSVFVFFVWCYFTRWRMEKIEILLLLFVVIVWILVCCRESARKDSQNFATNRKTEYSRFSVSTNQPI